jgi:hypothetical protein
MFEDGIIRVGDTLAALVAALHPTRLDSDTAATVFAALDRIERLAWAGKTVLAATVADAAAGPGGGGRCGTGGLARRAGTGAGTAREQVSTSRALPTLPVLAAALRAGALSATQASLIAAACTADPDAQQRLVDLAGAGLGGRAARRVRPHPRRGRP